MALPPRVTVVDYQEDPTGKYAVLVYAEELTGKQAKQRSVYVREKNGARICS